MTYVAAVTGFVAGALVTFCLVMAALPDGVFDDVEDE